MGDGNRDADRDTARTDDRIAAGGQQHVAAAGVDEVLDAVVELVVERDLGDRDLDQYLQRRHIDPVSFAGAIVDALGKGIGGANRIPAPKKLLLNFERS